MTRLSLSIRDERSGDADVVEALLERAFVNHPHSQQTEHLIVRRLRAGGQLVLPKIADLAGSIVGYATFSPVRLSPECDGWYGLGPVAVEPAHQRQGIGTMLIRAALEELKTNAAGCVVVGDPSFYRRFGFARQPDLMLAGIPPDYFLARAFGAPVPRARVSYHEAFSVTA